MLFLGLQTTCLGCAKDIHQATADLAARLRSHSLQSSLAGVTGKPWAFFFQRCAAQKETRAEVTRLESLARSGKPIASVSGLVQGIEPWQTLFFVREGWGWMLKPALSSVLFSDLWGLTYPSY